ncbi:endo alpha-1,4 polygalactosaminidase [Leucobacter sp. BZR 635]
MPRQQVQQVRRVRQRSSATSERSTAVRRLTGVVAVAALACMTALTGCAPATAAWALPPAGALPDYQLGEAYDADPRVGIIARDRTAPAAKDRYSICYINGFQTQPGELASWPENVLLHTAGGEIRFDPDWPDEALLDTSSTSARTAIVDTVSDWIEGCARDGFDAVEFDNLDSYTRSDGALTLADNLAVAAELVRVAHGAGLAAGQKNASEDAAAWREQASFDFAITEECSVFDECGAYTAVYGDHVINIEYADDLPRPFAEMCADEAAPASMVLRDRMLGAPGDPDYTFELCD